MATYSQAVQEDGFIEARNPKKRQRASTGQEPVDSPQRSGEQLTVTIKPIVAKQSVAKLNGLAIAREVARIAGGNVKTVKKRGNCLVVHTHNQRQATNMTDAVKFANIDVSITLGKPDGPPKKGVIMGIPHDVSDEEILEALAEQGVCTAKRITKKVNGQVEKTMAILVTFKVKIPTNIFFGYEKKKVTEYVPPVMRCFNCQKYGHGANTCRGRVRCSACGQGHKWEECPNKGTPKCARCGGAHSAAYLGCPKYKEAKQVQTYKYKEHVSYSEALKVVKEINSAKVTESQNATKAAVAPKAAEAPKAHEAPKPSSVPTNSEGQQNKGQQKSKIPKRSVQKTNKSKEGTPSPPKPKTQNSECQTDSIVSPPTAVATEQIAAFIAFIINSLDVYKTKSDRIKLVVNAAEKCCGVKIAPNQLHEVLAATSS